MRGEKVGRAGREGDTASSSSPWMLLRLQCDLNFFFYTVTTPRRHNVKKGFALFMELSLDLLTLLYGSKMRETIMAEGTHDGGSCSPHDIQYAERKE